MHFNRFNLIRNFLNSFNYRFIYILILLYISCRTYLFKKKLFITICVVSKMIRVVMFGPRSLSFIFDQCLRHVVDISIRVRKWIRKPTRFSNLILSNFIIHKRSMCRIVFFMFFLLIFLSSYCYYCCKPVTDVRD